MNSLFCFVIFFWFMFSELVLFLVEKKSLEFFCEPFVTKFRNTGDSVEGGYKSEADFFHVFYIQLLE